MRRSRLEQAVEIAARAGFVMLATVDEDGTPHMTAAGKIEVASRDSLAVTEWFCPTTVANLRRHSPLAILAWDRQTDSGLQLYGTCASMHDEAVFNGLAPKVEKEPPPPQAREKVLVNIVHTTDFHKAPHADVELE